jgi:hypothetical protein
VTAAGVICGDELAWSACAGFADIADGKATDPVMLYGVASFTRPASLRLMDVPVQVKEGLEHLALPTGGDQLIGRERGNR